MNYKLFKHALLDYENKYYDIEYEPLEIILKFKSPVISLWKSHFDGFLAGMLFQKIMREYNIYYHIDMNNELFDIPIPIKKLKISNDFIYKASSMFYENEIFFKKTTIKKRFSESNLALLSDIKKVIVNGGTYKNRDFPAIFEATMSNLKYFCVGNKAEINEILQLPLAIGKLRERGFGFIKNIQIKSIKKDNSIIYKDNLMRTVPVRMYSKLGKYYKISKEFKDNAYKRCILGEFNYKPPYFQIRDTELCYQPNI